jgi:hypothetical protein
VSIALRPGQIADFDCSSYLMYEVALIRGGKSAIILGGNHAQAACDWKGIHRWTRNRARSRAEIGY